MTEYKTLAGIRHSSDRAECTTADIEPTSSTGPITRLYDRMVGFDARNKNNILLIYRCQICGLILREPVQLDCGHRQCRSCVENIEGDLVKCPECQAETPKSEVLPDKGFRNDMQKLEILCSICDWIGLLKNYEEHLVQKHPNPPCEFCNKIFDSTAKLDLHKLNECDKVKVPCRLKDYGCSDSVVRIDMSNHYRTEQHQSAIMVFIKRDLSKYIGHQFEGGSGMDIDTQHHTTTSFVDNNSAQLEDVYETVDILASGIQALNEDAQRLNAEKLHLQNTLESLTKDFSTLKLSMEEQNTYLDGVKPNQEILHQDVASLKQKVEDSQFVSYDGTVTWKIGSFAEKMTDAQSERQTSIYSAPFYSSPTGYKMRGRIYLYGDGNARRTHISLFFVLMRSEYDAILKFPFNYKVTFCLYDQSGAQKHIIDSFRPDIKSNSFQRPRSEMNIASGIPKFVSLSTIQQEGNPYVRDDTMYIKIMVDFSDVPKNILSYALGLNPGLPTNVQQLLIKQELEKRVPPSSTSSTS